MLSRTAVSDFSLVLLTAELTADHRHRDGHHVMPPAIRKESMEIPKICRMPSPRNSDVRRMIATDRLAVRLVFITHRSRLIAGHTDEYRNNANR